MSALSALMRCNPRFQALRDQPLATFDVEWPGNSRVFDARGFRFQFARAFSCGFDAVFIGQGFCKPPITLGARFQITRAGGTLRCWPRRGDHCRRIRRSIHELPGHRSPLMANIRMIQHAFTKVNGVLRPSDTGRTRKCVDSRPYRRRCRSILGGELARHCSGPSATAPAEPLTPQLLAVSAPTPRRASPTLRRSSDSRVG
jgi:hypothetical protein